MPATLQLSCAILPESAYAEAARRLGVSIDDVEAIALGYRALRDGKVLEETAFWDAYPDDDFDDFIGERVLPGELLIREIEVARDPAQTLTAPLSAVDVAAADIHGLAPFLARMNTSGAPTIIARSVRALIHSACSTILAGADGAAHKDRWEPPENLMTGAPAEPGAAGEPNPMFAVPLGRTSYASEPRDCAFVGAGLLVQYPFASVVLGPDDGELRDVFATCDLRAVGSDERYVAFVCGGGPSASSGYFGCQVHVRDVVEHRWLTGPVPPSLPRYVAGAVGDVKWSIVIDVVEARGYRISPRWFGDQCGNTFNSACGRYAWDGGHFVVEAATGAAVVDARALQGDVWGFAKSARGWRFLMVAHPDDDAVAASEHDDDVPPSRVRLVDERGALIREIGAIEDAGVRTCALSTDGERLLYVGQQRVVVVDAVSGTELAPAIDLRPLSVALALPVESDLWHRLGAAYGVPADVARASAAELRAAVDRAWGNEPSDDDVAAAVDAAKRCAPLPPALPRLRAPSRS